MSKYYKMLTINDYHSFIENEEITNKKAFKRKHVIDKINMLFQSYGFLIIEKDNQNYCYFLYQNNYNHLNHILIEIYNPPSKLLNIISKIENLLNPLDNADNKN